MQSETRGSLLVTLARRVTTEPTSRRSKWVPDPIRRLGGAFRGSPFSCGNYHDSLTMAQASGRSAGTTPDRNRAAVSPPPHGGCRTFALSACQAHRERLRQRRDVVQLARSEDPRVFQGELACCVPTKLSVWTAANHSLQITAMMMCVVLSVVQVMKSLTSQP